MQTKTRASTNVDTNNVPQPNLKDDATAVIKLSVSNNIVATRRLIDQTSKYLKMKNPTEAYHHTRGRTSLYKRNQIQSCKNSQGCPLNFTRYQNQKPP